MKTNKSAKKFDLAKFEPLSNKGQVLKGGFSTTFSGAGEPIKLELPDINANIGDCSGTTTNTCNTGNCVAGCGVK